MRTKLRRPQPFLALLQMCQLLKEGPQHPGASRPQGRTGRELLDSLGNVPNSPHQLHRREKVPLFSYSALVSSALCRRGASAAERTPRCLLREHTSSDLSCHRLISNGSRRFLLLPKASFKLVRKVQARGIFILCILILTAQAKCC